MSEYLTPIIDIETFGLDEKKDLIIELGLGALSIDLKMNFSSTWTIWSPRHEKRLNELCHEASGGNKGAKYVLDMHHNSGLFEKARLEYNSMIDVELDAKNFVKLRHLEGRPLLGNSVRFDRRFLSEYMPNLEAMFHYRIIDVSSIKELCKMYNPKVYEELPAKEEKHRATPDIRETIEELRYYRDNFLKVSL